MEDEFGDDDAFDEIPDNAWSRLEQAAISSTQRSQVPNVNLTAPKQSRIQTYGSVGLSRRTNVKQNPWRPPQPLQRATPPQLAAQPAHPPPSAPNPPSSDYGLDEEDVIDLDEPSMVVESASGLPHQSRNESFARPPIRSARPPPDVETEAAFAAADAELNANGAPVWINTTRVAVSATADVSALQARIADLEASNARLQNCEQNARQAAQQKAGEIAIVRANHDRSSKEYERRIAVMQKLHADESARQKAELESGRKEREKMETSNRFLQHDLAQEAERAKGLRGTGRARVAAGPSSGAASTPRKDRRVEALGDGFDDDEVGRMVSPSKSKERSREQTPKVGTKRKRAAQDSPLPAPALSFSDAVPVMGQDSLEPATSERNVYQPSLADDRYEFMQKLLRHIPYEGAERTISSLMRLALPSDTSRTIATRLTDGLSSSTLSSRQETLPLSLARVSFEIWSQCLQEHFYEPIYLLLDLIDFALTTESASTKAQLVPHGVRICIKSIDLIAATNLKAIKYPAFAASDEYRKIQAETGQHIDADEVMDLLHRICDAASLNTDTCEDFWRTVELTFILQMLQKAQPLSQIATALQMLSTSVLETSFGPLVAILPFETASDADAAQRQAKQERDLLDRLTSLLLETPIAPSGEPEYSSEEIQQLRIEILSVFSALCLTEHGLLRLSQHRSAIGRLVKFLEAQVTRLYFTRPSLGLQNLTLSEKSSTPRQPLLHDLITSSVNTTVRLLSHLLQSPAVDLQQKVSVIRGGWHKFLVAFTRIAFSDQLVLEAGIANEVVEAAHAVLDQVLSPEEGEAVLRALETPMGSNKRSGGDGRGMSAGMGDEEDSMDQDPD